MSKIWIVAFALVLLAQPQFAGMIYGNLGPGDSFSDSSVTLSTMVMCPPPLFGPCPATYAQAFIPTASGALDQMIIGGTTGSSFGSHSLYLANDSGGLPGASIENLSLSTGTATLLRADSVLHPFLSAGTQYWVWTSWPAGVDVWKLNSTGQTGGRALSAGSGWTSQGAIDQLSLQVTSVEAVPEPASGVLLLSAFAAGGFIRALRSRRVR